MINIVLLLAYYLEQVTHTFKNSLNINNNKNTYFLNNFKGSESGKYILLRYILIINFRKKFMKKLKKLSNFLIS